MARRLADLGGAARRRDVIRGPGDVGALGRAIADRTVVRVAHGVYGLPGCTPTTTAAAVHGAAIGCVSAAERAGIAVLTPPSRPHLVVPRGRGRSPSQCRDAVPAVLHRESWCSAGRVGGVEVVPVDRALARMLLCRPTVDAIVAIDSALQKQLTTITSIAELLPSTAPSRIRWALALADGRSRSPLETVARLALRAAGFSVDVAVVVPMVGEVDLVVDRRVVVELDGFAYHGDRREFQEDRRRDRELALQGYVVLRFTAQDVLRDLDRLVATVRAALGAPRAPSRR